MKAFSEPLRRGFEDRMVMHMRGRSSRAAHLSEPEVRVQTLEVIELAETHGIDREHDVQCFLEIIFDRWPDARDNAHILGILNADLAARVKLAFIADALVRGVS